jgi:hypothetical protein
MKAARKSEHSINFDNGDLDETYLKYEEAYNAYAFVDNFIDDSYKKIEHVKKKANLKQSITIIGITLTAIGVIISIILHFFF